MLKRSMFVIISVLFAVPMFLGTVVYGETGSGATGTPTTTTTTSETEEETETEAEKTQRETRIKTLRETQKVKLSVTEKKKIQEKCKAGQGKVSSVKGKIKGIETSRTQVHKNLMNRMNKLVEKLKAKGVDTTALEADIAVLQTKIDLFNTDLATYKQSVADLAIMDCKTDPEGFKAALATARTNLEKVRTDAKEVHNYLKDTIKPLLKTLRDKVEGSATSEPETNNEQGGVQ